MRASEPLEEAHRGARSRRVRGGVEARPAAIMGPTNDSPRGAACPGFVRFQPTTPGTDDPDDRDELDRRSGAFSPEHDKDCPDLSGLRGLIKPGRTSTFRLLATGEGAPFRLGCSRLDGPSPARGRSTGAPSKKARAATTSTRRAVAEPERTGGEESDADTPDRHSSVPPDGVRRTRPLRVETPSVRRRPRPAAPRRCAGAS